MRGDALHAINIGSSRSATVHPGTTPTEDGAFVPGEVHELEYGHLGLLAGGWRAYRSLFRAP